MKKHRVHVSDHALVRYIERVLGNDLDGLRDEIATRVERAVALRADAVIVDGFRFVVDGKVVVTVHEAHEPCKRTGCVKDKRRMPDRD